MAPTPSGGSAASAALPTPFAPASKFICPKCSQPFTAMHCKGCNWYWCGDCKLTERVYPMIGTSQLPMATWTVVGVQETNVVSPPPMAPGSEPR